MLCFFNLSLIIFYTFVHYLRQIWSCQMSGLSYDNEHLKIKDQNISKHSLLYLFFHLQLCNHSQNIFVLINNSIHTKETIKYSFFHSFFFVDFTHEILSKIKLNFQVVNFPYLIILRLQKISKNIKQKSS